MSFRKMFSWAFVSLLGLNCVSCTDFLKGKQAEPEVIELTNNRLTCLQKVPNQLKKFTVGEAEESDIRESFDCMADGLRYFNKRTFGSVQGAYTAAEMRNFFGKYFLKENNVSPEFAFELMKLKKAVLGGSTAYITKIEIEKLIEILDVLRDEFVDLGPHVKVLLLRSDSAFTEWDQLVKATEQLRKTAQRLIIKTQVADSDYGFEDAKVLVAGFAEFVQGGQAFAPYDHFSSWVPAVEAIKNVLMGRRAHFVDINDWKSALNTVLDLYGLALKYHYNLRASNFDSISKVRQASQFFNQVLSLIRETHQMRAVGLIPLEDIDRLIQEILPWTQISISEKALKKTYRAVLIKILDPGGARDSRNLLGLEKKHLAALQREFDIWRLQQSFVDSLFKIEKESGFTQSEVYQKFQVFDKTSMVEKDLTPDPYEQRALFRAWEDFGDLLSKPISANFNSNGLVVINANHAVLKHNWLSLTQENLMRALSRMLLLGYGENIKDRLSDAGMTKAGLISWYDDFQELGLELKAFDPRAANSGSRSFLEANFFTFSGNGDQYMDHRETYEFVSLLFSAGLFSSEKIRRHMIQANCGVKEKDVFDNPFFENECFKTQLKTNFSQFFGNMAGLSRYVKSLNQEQWDAFYGYLMVASEAPSQRRGFVETANLRTLVMILHYMEGMLIVFDSDLSDTLSLKEIYQATPRFLSFLRTLSPVSNETLVREGFAYLVFEGAIPTATDLLSFQLKKLQGLGEAQRLEIVRIFGTLKDKIGQSKK